MCPCKTNSFSATFCVSVPNLSNNGDDLGGEGEADPLNDDPAVDPLNGPDNLLEAADLVTFKIEVNDNPIDNFQGNNLASKDNYECQMNMEDIDNDFGESVIFKSYCYVSSFSNKAIEAEMDFNIVANSNILLSDIQHDNTYNT